MPKETEKTGITAAVWKENNDQRPRLVATLPAFNEVKFIERAVESVQQDVSRITDDYVIVVAEDGSTDGTLNKIIELSRSNPKLTCFHSDRRLGRGRSLTRAWAKVDGDIFLYLDSDLAADMKSLLGLVKGIEMGYDLVTGSRYLPESNVERPPLRMLVSRTYNRIMNRVFHTTVHDHQCGFKAFSRRLVRQVLPRCASAHWFWDSEIITLAKSEGYTVLEIPVSWKERRGKKTPLRRLLNDIGIHALGIIRLWSSTRARTEENQAISGTLRGVIV